MNWIAIMKKAKRLKAGRRCRWCGNCNAVLAEPVTALVCGTYASLEPGRKIQAGRPELCRFAEEKKSFLLFNSEHPARGVGLLLYPLKRGSLRQKSAT
jgi:hypothetical protein